MNISSLILDLKSIRVALIKQQAVAVQLEYHGADFTIDSASYSGTRVSLTIPENELGSTTLTVTYPSGNYDELYINGSLYATS